jgi:hypothetical protein
MAKGLMAECLLPPYVLNVAGAPTYCLDTSIPFMPEEERHARSTSIVQKHLIYTILISRLSINCASLIQIKTCLVLISCLVDVATTYLYQVLVQVCTYNLSVKGLRP